MNSKTLLTTVTLQVDSTVENDTDARRFNENIRSTLNDIDNQLSITHRDHSAVYAHFSRVTECRTVEKEE